MLARNEPRARGAVVMFRREAYQQERSMKRLALRKSLALALLATLTVSTAAHGEEKPAASDEEGKVTLDTDSLQVNGQYVRARFWSYTGDARVPVVAMVEGCDKGSGKISYNVHLEQPHALIEAAQAQLTSAIEATFTTQRRIQIVRMIGRAHYDDAFPSIEAVVPAHCAMVVIAHPFRGRSTAAKRARVAS